MSSTRKIDSSIIQAAVGVLQPFYSDLTPAELAAWLESRSSQTDSPQIKDAVQKPYTRFEVAGLLGLSTQTINRMLNAGTLRRIHIGKRAVRIDPASVKELLEHGISAEVER